MTIQEINRFKFLSERRFVAVKKQFLPSERTKSEEYEFQGLLDRIDPNLIIESLYRRWEAKQPSTMKNFTKIHEDSYTPPDEVIARIEAGYLCFDLESPHVKTDFDRAHQMLSRYVQT